MLCALFIHNETCKSSVLIIDCVLHCSFVSLIAAGSSGELKHFISTDNKFYVRCRRGMGQVWCIGSRAVAARRCTSVKQGGHWTIV